MTSPRYGDRIEPSPRALQTEVRRLNDAEINYFCNRNSRTRDVKSFAGMAPTRSVTALIIYAHRYCTSRKLDVEQEATIWTMVERMQVSHTEPLRPVRTPDLSQASLFDDRTFATDQLSSRTIAAILLETRQWSEPELAFRVGVPLDAIQALRRGSRVAPYVRQVLVRLYNEREITASTMGV